MGFEVLLAGLLFGGLIGAGQGYDAGLKAPIPAEAKGPNVAECLQFYGYSADECAAEEADGKIYLKPCHGREIPGEDK